MLKESLYSLASLAESMRNAAVASMRQQINSSAASKVPKGRHMTPGRQIPRAEAGHRPNVVKTFHLTEHDEIEQELTRNEVVRDEVERRRFAELGFAKE